MFGTRDELILTALAAAGENATFEPVQVQKLFFLLDKQASHLIGGPKFNFTPYDYGPFDRSVYQALEELMTKGLANITSNGRYRLYSLSQHGFYAGNAKLNSLPVAFQDYLKKLSTWVKSMPFEQLVSTIYQQYPDMRANSVFRG